jgi:hypothetical protein
VCEVRCPEHAAYPLSLDTYIANQFRDPIALKLLGKIAEFLPACESDSWTVYAVMTIILIQTAFETYSGYALLVVGWGNRIVLEMPPKLIIPDPLFDAICRIPARFFDGMNI